MSLHIKTNETEQYACKLSYEYMKLDVWEDRHYISVRKTFTNEKMYQIASYPYTKSTSLLHTTYKHQLQVY